MTFFEVGHTYHWLHIRMWYGIELVEVEFEIMADIDVGTLILSAVAVLRSREDWWLVSRNLLAVKSSVRTCDAPPIMLYLIALHADLVTSNDSFQSVCFAETFRHVWSKLQANSSLTWSSAWGRLWVGP